MNIYIYKKKKSKLNNYAKLNQTDKDDVICIKQVPVHPRDWLKKQQQKLEDQPKFIKQVPLHTRNRLTQKEAQITRSNVSKLCTENLIFP